MDGPIDHACRSASALAETADFSCCPGRARLAAESRALAAATSVMETAQQQATRLSAAIAEASLLGTELAALRAADEATLGAWLAGNRGAPRPQPNPAILDAESRLARLAEDAAAARAALPAAEQAFQCRAERVRLLQRRRDDALCAAAVDAARAAAESYRAVLIAALEQEARLRGLHDELLLWGNRADSPSAALAAAAQIGDLITGTRRAAAVERNPAAGRGLIEALAADPDASL
jgi:hypothetical protein